MVKKSTTYTLITLDYGIPTTMHFIQITLHEVCMAQMADPRTFSDPVDFLKTSEALKNLEKFKDSKVHFGTMTFTTFTTFLHVKEA